MEQITRIGMDTSKNVFQLHGVNAAEEPILRKKLTRSRMIEFFKWCCQKDVAGRAVAA